MSLSVLSLTRLEKELSGGGLLGKGRASFDGQQWVSRPEMLRNVLCSGRAAPRPVANSTVSASSASHLSKRRLGWPSCSLLSRPYISFLCVDGGPFSWASFFFSLLPLTTLNVCCYLSRSPSSTPSRDAFVVCIFFLKNVLSSTSFHSIIAFIHPMSDMEGRRRKVSVSRRIGKFFFFFFFQQLFFAVESLA